MADIKFVSEVQFNEYSNNIFLPISSVVMADAVDEIMLEEISLLKEKMPRAFGENRTLKAMKSYFIEDNCRNINVKIKNDFTCWVTCYDDREEFIMFM